MNNNNTKCQWRVEEWLWRDRRMSKAVAGPSHIKTAFRAAVLSSYKTTPAIYHYSKRDNGEIIIEFHG